MAFDAVAYVDLLDHPEITVKRKSWGGLILAAAGIISPTKTYRGRLLSHRQWAPMAERFGEAASGDLDERQTREAYGVYLDAIGIPRHVVFDLPTSAMLAALLDFFVCQKRALSLPEGVVVTALDPSPPETGSPNGGNTKSETKSPAGAASP